MKRLLDWLDMTTLIRVTMVAWGIVFILALAASLMNFGRAEADAVRRELENEPLKIFIRR